MGTDNTRWFRHRRPVKAQHPHLARHLFPVIETSAASVMHPFTSYVWVVLDHQLLCLCLKIGPDTLTQVKGVKLTK
jgi:hypothetical protein